MSIRIALLFSALALLSGMAPAHARPLGRMDGDLVALRQMALGLHGLTTRSEIQRLSHTRLVRSAVIGRDGRTVIVTFHDGRSMAILPDLPVQPSAASHTPDLEHSSAGTGRRAAVLEPFASDQMGTGDGNLETQVLQRHGFAVDSFADQQVTVDLMRNLSSYDVVYMHTHAGVNQWGYAVISTGQLVQDDSAMQPLIDSGDVMVVGIVGRKQQYYGILIPFIQHFMGRFPANSILYIDTCSLLRADPLWKALSDKNAGALVSWDDESEIPDESAAAWAFFRSLDAGASVAQATDAVKAAGLATSVVDGKPGHFGYRGDGDITLDGHLASPAATATPPAIIAPTPAAPTASPAPTMVPPVPAPALAVHLDPRVRPGQQQHIRVTGLPGSAVRVTIVFPNGDRTQTTMQIGSSGSTIYAFSQHGSQIVPGGRVADVEVSQGAASTTARYTILPGPVDVAVQPRVTAAGRHIAIWLHLAKAGRARVAVRRGIHRLGPYRLLFAHAGWNRLRYMVPVQLPAVRLVIRVAVRVHGNTHTTSTSLVVQPGS